MRLGINLAYWSTAEQAQELLTLAREADSLGYSVAWTAEAYGSDCVSTLAWITAQTERIDIGSAIFQIPARTPAMTAMTAASLDALSGGRFRLGLGVSGPQVSEGWHGVRYDNPLGRTREYVEIVKMALRRERVVHAGKHFELPLPDGPGKALKLIVHPVREQIPVYLAAVGPKNLELCGEIADGWLAIFYSAKHAAEQLAAVEKGARTAGKDGLTGFDVVPSVPLSIGPDVVACADPLRPYAALYLGGMGSREKNFYNALARRYGYDEGAQQVQDLFLSGDKWGAMAAVPVDFIDETSLLGPVERIAERMAEYAASGVTTLALSNPPGMPLEQQLTQLRQAADALDKAGIGE
ncbi:MAG TPA: LLM class F420-dependent oxidoreductase [Mycobacteriales bacterium]|nr:LLM class F420-dependent oxidoreductase [Mycobacteriales bacterium]